MRIYLFEKGLNWALCMRKDCLHQAPRAGVPSKALPALHYMDHGAGALQSSHSLLS